MSTPSPGHSNSPRKPAENAMMHHNHRTPFEETLNSQQLAGQPTSMSLMPLQTSAVFEENPFCPKSNFEWGYETTNSQIACPCLTNEAATPLHLPPGTPDLALVPGSPTPRRTKREGNEPLRTVGPETGYRQVISNALDDPPLLNPPGFIFSSSF